MDDSKDALPGRLLSERGSAPFLHGRQGKHGVNPLARRGGKLYFVGEEAPDDGREHGIGDSEAAVSAPIHSSVSGKVKAIEQIFGVKVEKVNTIRMEGKAKRQGVTSGHRANWKKAMVKLTADSKTIEFFEGMV